MKNVVTKNTVNITFKSLVILIFTRLIPHPPNFTALIAVSIYVPMLCGQKHLYGVILAMILTDLFLGFHPYIFWTWGSIIFIGTISKFYHSVFVRYTSVILGTLAYYIITNFGVWLAGDYGYSISGIFACYTVAIPFLGNSMAAAIFFATIFELLFLFKPIRETIKRINPTLLKI